MKRDLLLKGALATGIVLLSGALLAYFFYAADNSLRTTAGKNSPEENSWASNKAEVGLIGYSDTLDEQVFDDERVGGISGLAYDSRRELYYAPADRREGQASRFYTLRLPLGEGQLGEPEIFDATVLQDSEGRNFGGGRHDGEGIDVTSWGDLLIASEAGPTVRRFSHDGRFLQEIPVPQKFFVDSGGGQPNSTFEGLSLTPDGGSFFVAPQKSLVFDASEGVGQQRVRLLRYESRGLDDYQPSEEFFYLTDSAAGVADVEALSDNELLVLEHGNKLFRVDTSDAEDVSAIDSLVDGNPEPLKKELVADLQACVVEDQSSSLQSETPAVTYEGLALGPTLPNGGRTLLLVGDDDFKDEKITRVLALGIWPQRPGETPGSDCQ